MAELPIFINCRDRVTHLAELVLWLERAGHERILLLDNDSSYPPLLEYYERSRHRIIRLGTNLGSRSLWAAGLVPSEPFVFTDPDVIPLDSCPADAVAYLDDLRRFYRAPKVGLGLYLDDLPTDFDPKLLDWERRLYLSELRSGVFQSLVDTTFAAYPANAWFGLEGLRTSAPYAVRHMPWYSLGSPTEEDRYYLERAIAGPRGSAWADYLRLGQRLAE